MRHFFTKSTVEAEMWCQRCHKETMWRIMGRRPGYCMVCQAIRENPPLPGIVAPEAEQMDMFDDSRK